MIRKLNRFVKALLITAGLVAIALVAICFTSLPWRFYHWLSADSFTLNRPPDYIVVMGGGGIPSESGLMRTYEGASAARTFPKAKIIVALPSELNAKDDDAYRMKHELTIRGVRSGRIEHESKGRNTREQALDVARMIDVQSHTVLLITSPEHVKRTLMAFRKAGCRQIAGHAAYETSITANLLYSADALGGTNIPLLNIGGQLTLRYGFWNNVQYLCDSSREFCALGYYWLKGWI